MPASRKQLSLIEFWDELESGLVLTDTIELDNSCDKGRGPASYGEGCPCNRGIAMANAAAPRTRYRRERELPPASSGT